MLDWLKNLFAGKKTYLAAAGLLGMALYQVSIKDFAKAAEYFLAALAAFGIRSAMDRNSVPPVPPPPVAPLPVIFLCLFLAAPALAVPLPTYRPVAEVLPLPKEALGGCSKKCNCGCQEGQECDCVLLARLPSEKHIEAMYRLAGKRIDELRNHLDLFNSDTFSTSLEADTFENRWRAEMEETRKAREVWLAAWWVVWPQSTRDQRKEWAATLRDLIGDRAYITGELPPPIPAWRIPLHR